MAGNLLSISAVGLSLQEIYLTIGSDVKISLSPESVRQVERCRNFLDKTIQNADQPIYGVNTGFGALCNTLIAKEMISQLQANLVLSHACGMGRSLAPELSKLMLLLKIVNLSLGHSGIGIATLERLVFMYNHDIIPVIPEQGSLGASGDLAPLAHLALPLIGRGEVWSDGKKIPSKDVLARHQLEPLTLYAKEGLALINGTQFMCAHLIYVLGVLEHLLHQQYVIASMSLDAFDCSIDPFREEVHRIRAHEGQVETARNIRNILKGSNILNGKKEYVQDPYSFRCIPQVLGASLDVIRYARNVAGTELAGVSDNPLLFPEEEMILSAGNFHGQPLALALDFLAIALAELASISERRTYKLISGQRKLPAFLSSNPGLHSGFMIPQYTAASMVSQNKQLCTPASVDTIDSSNGQEDHVSMGANAALKCLRVYDNYRRVLAIELFTAAQALNFRRPSKSSETVEKYFEAFRQKVPFLEEDTEMHVWMNLADKFLVNQRLPGH